VATQRVVFTGGRLFDAEAATFAPGDVAVADGRIVEVGAGLAGDEAVDVSGQVVLPGLFDCHVHLTMSHLDTARHLYEPRSLR
jgi:cytosine/adenosine deaminase-related metal-dependent hydrolase